MTNPYRVKDPEFHPELHEKLWGIVKEKYPTTDFPNTPDETSRQLLIFSCAKFYFQQYRDAILGNGGNSLSVNQAHSGTMDPILGISKQSQKPQHHGQGAGGQVSGTYAIYPKFDTASWGHGGASFGLGPDKSGIGYIPPMEDTLSYGLKSMSDTGIQKSLSDIPLVEKEDVSTDSLKSKSGKKK